MRHLQISRQDCNELHIDDSETETETYYINNIIHLFTPSSPAVYQFGPILIMLLLDL